MATEASANHAAPKDKAHDADADEAPPKKSMMPLLVAGNSVMLLATLALVFVRTGQAPAAPAAEAKGEGHGEGAAAEHEEPPKGEGHGAKAEGGHGGKGAPGTGPGPMVQLGEFIVRLPSAEGDRYARFSFEVQVRSQEEADLVKLQLPEVRDRFIMLLSDLTPDAVRGKAELDAIKERLMKELRSSQVGNAVRALYLTEFVVQ